MRIKGIYLAIATLAAQFIIEWTINHVTWISGGIESSIQVPPPSVFGTRLESQHQLYFFLLFFAVLAIVATLNLVRSRVGRAFIAIRDQDIAAEIIGINIFRYKLYAFAISSFYAGVTGVLYTYYLGIANYEQFQIERLDRLPGDDHHRRARLGARFDLRRDLHHRAADRDAHSARHFGGMVFSAASIANIVSKLRLVIFGALIILFLVVEPEGLNRLWRNIRNYFRVWPFSY